MTAIHPQALVDPTAELAEDVEVGPFAIIGPDVTIDEGTVVGPHAILKGPTTIGARNRFFNLRPWVKIAKIKNIKVSELS